eukprot:GHVT01013839.1.p1 GENE.GHVT01013839.1~~GHVT01013839.1.p1  ORF type:complete len:316 (-),score=36.50 GHVT01013839.1:487-1434(-)
MMRPIPLLLRFPLRLGPARANSLVLELLSRLCSSLSYARSDGLFRLAAWYASPGDPSQGCSASVMGFLFARLTSVWPGVPRCLSAPHVDSDVLHDRSSSCDFFTIAKDLEPPGVLMDTTKYKFLFNSVDMAYDTYQGVNVRLRYFVRLCIARSYATSISKEVDVIVQNLGIPPEVNNTIKMEVGIEDCLHIEFEYDKSRYHLRDVVVGKVYFLLVRIKIKHMELDIVRTETAGAGSNAVTDSETFAKFEIMDGAPIRSECIPVRMYLSGFDLFPTQKNIVHRFSVRYWLNLVLVDEEDRRYFKKQEIILWRKKIG